MSLPIPRQGSSRIFPGAARKWGPYAIQLCETDDFCFDFTIADDDVGQSLSLVSTVLSVLPGSTLNVSGTNPVSGTICWTAPVGSSGLHVFTIAAEDDACR
jgi:hypothetical protein